MIDVLIGDLFESKAQTLINTVNCVGIMGKGIALEFKKRFPEMYEDYVRRCAVGDVKLGQPYLFRRLIEPWIINFPTKDHWRSVARIHDILEGLKYLRDHYREWGITSVAVPPLGCGEGQLEWRVVGPTLYRYLGKLDIPIELYAPYGTPPSEMTDNFLNQPPEITLAGPGQGRITPGWIALIEILSRIENQPYHWPTGRTIFQKITYFATEKNIPTGLRHMQGSFGPYAPDLKSKITQLVNNGLICEERQGNSFSVKVGPTFKDAKRTYSNELETMTAGINEVADLFLRMNTKQAELAATVHFAYKTVSLALTERPSENDVLAYVMKWKQKRRPPIEESDVAGTIRNLAALNIIDVTASTDLPIPDEVTA
jgi:O-acetyl-ADP-ribose deacetylase (regulator of RNase III)/uncharacterized protein YwgA